MILRHTFAPPNNTRIDHLCGPMDTHLRTIELALQVVIAHRFEQFKIEGSKARATRALEMVQALYEIAARPISVDTVQLMLAGDAPLGVPVGGESDLLLQTRRTDLRARTPNQALYLENIASHDITLGIGPAGTGKTDRKSVV